jgi:hypothetical protein
MDENAWLKVSHGGVDRWLHVPNDLGDCAYDVICMTTSNYKKSTFSVDFL